MTSAPPAVGFPNGVIFYEHFSHTELMDTRAARPFSFSFNTSDYRILLMDQDQGRLYLGSREYLVALDMHNVNKEPLIVCTNSTSLLILKSSLLFG